MKSIRAVLLMAVVVSALATSGVAQQLTVGYPYSGVANASDYNFGIPQTDIDLSSPATGTGVLTTARFEWASASCANTAKIKFFQRNGDTLTFFDERGPFSTTDFDNVVALNPPVQVQQGDLIGVTHLTPCGGPQQFANINAAPGHVEFPGDINGSVSIAAAAKAKPAPLAVYATGNLTEAVAAVLPVVGATAGSSGAHFTTSLQLANGSQSTLTGKLVFHPAGTSGSPTDPTITYSVAPLNVYAYPNLRSSFSTTGLGSIDVVVPVGSSVPNMVTRIYNDAGAAGTSGLTEDPIDPTIHGIGHVVIAAGELAVMITPVEPARTRFNIGVRTYSSGATFTASLLNPDASVVTMVSKSYPPNDFEQTDSTSFLGGVPVGANQSIYIDVTAGAATVYGATTDNVTNDPSIQFAHVVRTGT